MEKRKLKIALSLAVLIPCVLYVAGIIAQFMINIKAWKAAGSDYRVSPGLPSLELADVFRAIFHFPEGLIAIGVVVVGIVLICIFGLRIGWGQNGVTDSDRNLTVSNSGSYGTASFMSPKEASACFDVTSAKKTEQDILGMLPDGQILTLPKNTRLNSNLAVCGSSGTGKSRSISRNLVLQAVKRGESLVLTDPKSELYESMSEYLRDNGYTVKVFNLIEMDHSDSWNCLNEVGSSELMAQTFADIVLQNTSGDSKDAFWYNAELNLLKALVLYVALEMPPEQRNLATVYDLLYTQTEKGLSDIMASISHEHVNQYTGELLPPSPAAAPYAIFKQSSETVRTSVIIGLGSKLAVLQAQQVRNITSYNEIDLELPGKQKCAYFCIVSDQDSTFDFLSSLFFSFLFIRLIRYADGYCEGGMLSTKVKFVLDEFPNCCLIPDFTKKCSTIRSRGCSVAVFFQNVGQMRNRYPDDQWQEILGACDSTVFLGCTDMLTAEYFSDRIGTASVEVEGTMRELNTMHITNYTPRFRKTNSLGRRQLLTPDEVLRLPPDQVLIFIRGQKVMRAKRYDYSLHPDYKKLKSRKAILHEPDWKTSQASSVSATGPSPSASVAIPVEKGSSMLPKAMKNLKYRVIFVSNPDPEEPELQSELLTPEFYLTRLKDFSDFVHTIRSQRNVLMAAQHRAELEIEDIEHAAEFYNLDASHGYQLYKLLHDARVRRRKCKNAIAWIDYILEQNPDRFVDNEPSARIAGTRFRDYAPRALPGLFEWENEGQTAIADN